MRREIGRDGKPIDPLSSSPASTKKLEPPPASKRPRSDDPEIDEMLAALKKRIGK